MRKQIIAMCNVAIMVAGITLAAEKSDKADNSIAMNQSKNGFTQLRTGDGDHVIQTVDLNGIPFGPLPEEKTSRPKAKVKFPVQKLLTAMGRLLFIST